MSRATLYVGDALEVLRTLPDESVQMCCTSPPYWGLRDYGVDGQLGLEPTPWLYVEDMVTAFGSGTTAAVATGLGRNAIHIDLNPEYLNLAIDRIGPFLCDVKEVAA